MNWRQVSNVQHLGMLLDSVIERLYIDGSGAAMFAHVQRVTGLRSVEVLERERWLISSGGEVSVQLAKKGTVRIISAALLPAEYLEYLVTPRLAYTWSYQAYLYDLNKTGIEFKFAGIKKSTYSHAFRYGKFRELMAELGNIQDVQSEMHHAATGSTLYYLMQPALYKDLRGSL